MSFACYFDLAKTHELPDRYAPCLSCKQTRGMGCAGSRNCGCPDGASVVLDRETVAHRMPDRSILLEGADRMFALSAAAVEKVVTGVAGWVIPDMEILSGESQVCSVCGNGTAKHELTDYDFGDGRSGLFLLCTVKDCKRGNEGVPCYQLAMKEYDPLSWLRRRKEAV